MGGYGRRESRDSRGKRDFDRTFRGETVVFPAKRRRARRRASGIRHAFSPARAEPRGILRVRSGENRGSVRDVRRILRRRNASGSGEVRAAVAFRRAFHCVERWLRDIANRRWKIGGEAKRRAENSANSMESKKRSIGRACIPAVLRITWE